MPLTNKRQRHIQKASVIDDVLAEIDRSTAHLKAIRDRRRSDRRSGTDRRRAQVKLPPELERRSGIDRREQIDRRKSRRRRSDRHTLRESRLQGRKRRRWTRDELFDAIME